VTDAAVAARPARSAVEPSPLAGYAATTWGLLLRDTRVLRRQVFQFVTRSVMQPFLFVFVFAYVFPKIGQSFGGGPAGVSFATILVPGLVAVAIIFQGISAVALPLVTEFNITREIEDRAMAPLPTGLIAVEKVVFGAAQGVLSAAFVFPLVYLVPATEVTVSLARWPLLLVAVLASCLTAGALGLTIGTAFRPNQVPLLFSVIVLPITFLGCVYYPWAQLESVRWLQVLVLANPLVYVSEALRAALTPDLPHLSPVVSLLALAAFGAVLAVAGVRGFRRRVLS
jgi:ABC-2 type transport system permease protein